MGDLIVNNDFQALSKAFEVRRLEELLEEASRKGGRQNKFTTKKSFSPSSFYPYSQGVCPRYWHYAFNGEHFEYENTARQRANMDNGTAAGERIASLFESAGILVDAEREVKHDDPPIRGFIDLVVDWQGEEMIGEVKTTTDASFQKRAGKMKAPGYQLLQLLIYMYLQNKEKGFFVVENKDSHELLIIPVKMTDANRMIVEETFDWMRKVHANEELPKRPFTKSSWNCKSCPVQKACWGDGGFRKNSVNDPNPGTIIIEPLEVAK